MCRLHIADWPGAEKLADPLRTHIAEGGFVDSFVPMAFGFHPLDQLKSASRYIRTRIPAAPEFFTHSTAMQADKLRIAYLSSDFRQHPVGVAIAELLERHDKTRFEIIGVSNGSNDASDTRARIVAAFDQFHDVASDSDRNIARLLNDLQVHIAVALNGLTGGCRPGVLAYRPAPIQVSYLGYAGTTGAEFIDYILADATALPFDQQPFFTEKIVQLPDCYHANDTTPTNPAANSGTKRARAARSRTGVLLLQPELQDRRSGVRRLDAVVGARARERVVALEDERSRPSQPPASRRRARGIDPARLVFAPRLDRMDDHLARLNAARKRPVSRYSSLQRAFDGVRCAVGRSARRHLHRRLLCRPGRGEHDPSRGIAQLVTASLEDDEALALRLATDHALRTSIRHRLEDNRPTCPLFDGDRFRRHVEAAYTAMWDIHRRGENPRGLCVEPERAA